MTASLLKKPSTKLELLIKALGRPNGATIDELAKATGWQTHSVRGAMAGALKKKGFKVSSTKVDGKRRYQISEPSNA